MSPTGYEVPYVTRWAILNIQCEFCTRRASKPGTSLGFCLELDMKQDFEAESKAYLPLCYRIGR